MPDFNSVVLDSCNSLLCEALGAIGGLQPSALNNILTEIVKKLTRFSQLPDMTSDQINTKVSTNFFRHMLGIFVIILFSLGNIVHVIVSKSSRL